MVTLDRTPRAVRRDVCFGQLADSIHGQPPRRILIQRRVESARDLGDLRHARRIQPRLHNLAGSVADKFAPAEGNLRPLGGADTDGEDTDAIGRRLLSRGEAVGVQFLAIGNDDERARKSLGFPEGLLGHADGGGEVGAAFGNDRGVQLVERGQHRPVVEGQRGLEKSRAGKRNQSNPVGAEFADQVLGQKLRALKTRGRNIRREHGARHVHGNDHVTTTVWHLQRVVTEPRAGHGDNEQAEGEKHTAPAEPAPARAGVAREQVAQLGRDDAAQQDLTAPLSPPIEHDDQRQQPQEVQQLRPRKGQGRRLHIVCPRKVSAASRTVPTSTNQGKRSRYCATFCTSTRDFSNSSISRKICCKVCVSVARK